MGYLGSVIDMYHQSRFSKTHKTRLHSNRMRTARALTISPSMLCGGGGVCSGGCLLQRGGVCSWGVSAPGGCLPGGYPSMHWGRPPPCEQNSWHMPMKILPCPKLRLRAAIRVNAFLSHNQNFPATKKVIFTVIWSNNFSVVNLSLYLLSYSDIWRQERIFNIIVDAPIDILEPDDLVGIIMTWQK